MKKRIETGVVQFGEDDFPGVFIRGDHSFSYAANLRFFLNVMRPFVGEPTFDAGQKIRYKQLESLLRLLERSNTQNPKHKVDIVI